MKFGMVVWENSLYLEAEFYSIWKLPPEELGEKVYSLNGE